MESQIVHRYHSAAPRILLWLSVCSTSAWSSMHASVHAPTSWDAGPRKGGVVLGYASFALPFVATLSSFARLLGRYKPVHRPSRPRPRLSFEVAEKKQQRNGTNETEARVRRESPDLRPMRWHRRLRLSAVSRPTLGMGKIRRACMYRSRPSTSRPPGRCHVPQGAVPACLDTLPRLPRISEMKSMPRNRMVTAMAKERIYAESERSVKSRIGVA